MLAYTYKELGNFQLMEKEKRILLAPDDAIIKVTLANYLYSDLHIKHRAVPGITVGHEMVGIVEETGTSVARRKTWRQSYR